MNKIRFFIYCATFTAFVGVGLFISVDSAVAQEVNDDQTSEVIEEVVKIGKVVKIEAAFDRRLVGRQDEFGARTEIIELKQQVSFADLDLSKDTDVIKLKSRIEYTAKEACAELAEMRPIPLWDKAEHQRCITGAIESANDDLETITAAL